MPELPEVETTLKAILPYLSNAKIQQTVIRQHRLRWPIDIDFSTRIKNKVIKTIFLSQIIIII